MTELLRLEAPPSVNDNIAPTPGDGIALPPDQNPLSPGRPWFALTTGRNLPDGRPGMFFVSTNIGAGAFLGHVDSYQLGEQTLQMDPAIFELSRFGPNAELSGARVRSTVAEGGQALPEGKEWDFARYAGGAPSYRGRTALAWARTSARRGPFGCSSAQLDSQRNSSAMRAEVQFDSSNYDVTRNLERQV